MGKGNRADRDWEKQHELTGAQQSGRGGTWSQAQKLVAAGDSRPLPVQRCSVVEYWYKKQLFFDKNFITQLSF